MDYTKKILDMIVGETPKEKYENLAKVFGREKKRGKEIDLYYEMAERYIKKNREEFKKKRAADKQTPFFGIENEKEDPWG